MSHYVISNFIPQNSSFREHRAKAPQTEVENTNFLKREVYQSSWTGSLERCNGNKETKKHSGADWVYSDF